MHEITVFPPMAAAVHELPLITTIAAAFTAAWVLGLLTQWLRLSPIVGYLLAGIVIGPYTPGFVADEALAMQLSEMGVILLMFGVGLHFHLKDLLAVRNVAIPGAIGQSLVATLLGAAVAMAFGWDTLTHGLVLGMAMAVASTVVLIRVLTDNHVLESTAGHVAVGWLIVEDVLTVVVLVLIPVLGAREAGINGEAVEAASSGFLKPLLMAFMNLGILVAILLFAGSRVIPWIMVKIARLRSRELFTLTVMVMAIAIAAGAYYMFGASMALGAFLAGMVVGQSPVSQQAAADALPLRDAFAVLFFCSVGMLFDPHFIVDHPALLLAGLGIVMIGKPLAAIIIVAIIGYPARTALTVAFGLAQIGEFSFILATLAKENNLMSDVGNNLLVACALVSITLNPLIFKLIGPLEIYLQKKMPSFWAFLNRKSQKRGVQMNDQAAQALQQSDAPLAVVVGYGPVGQTVDNILRKNGIETVIIDMNMDTVQNLTRQGRAAMYGDAYNIEVMEAAMARATQLIITLPHSTNRGPVIAAAKLINPDIKIFVRARHLRERDELEQVGADAACYEEVEAAVALGRLVLFDRGADEETIRHETMRIRQSFMVPS